MSYAYRAVMTFLWFTAWLQTLADERLPSGSGAGKAW